MRRVPLAACQPVRRLGGWGRMAEIDGDDHSTWAAIRPQRLTSARAHEKLGANGRSSPVANRVAFGHSTPATPPRWYSEMFAGPPLT